MMKKNIAKLTLPVIAAISFSLPAFSATVLTHPTTVPVSAACYQARDNCLLAIEPSKWREDGKRGFALLPVCQSKEIDLRSLYFHELKMKDQISKRIFLGRTFCRGVLSLSNMHLPFVKERQPGESFKDGNDGILLLNVADDGLKQARDKLIALQTLAMEEASATAPSPADKVSQFAELLTDIDRLAQTQNLDGVTVLNSLDDKMIVPIHHGKDQVAVTLTRASTGRDGLNIYMLNINTVADAKAALKPLADSIRAIETGIDKLEQSRPVFEAALDADETVTLMDLTGSQFIIKQQTS